MQLRFYPYTIQLTRPFGLASGSRTTTPAMMVEVEKDGTIGYGEASMPPYIGETQETASRFLSRVDLSTYPDLFALADVLSDVDAIERGNCAAKAAVDIALHDWVGKRLGRSFCRIWGLDPATCPVTSFTIGMDSKEIVRMKVQEAAPYKVLKVKLGTANDRAVIEAVRSITDKPIRVDVNQGWREREPALRMIEWLARMGVELIEQPMPKHQVEDIAWLRERSPLPLFADESVARLAEVSGAAEVFDGINVKLMKSTGMHEAHRMILLGRSLGLKIMIGCMTETSCAISAAAQLSPLADYADLDGALLISNDLFRGARIVDGKVTPGEEPGIGVSKLS